MENTVVVKNLEKKFGDETVLFDINLTLEKGKIIALLGADGSGKTTLIRAILGLVNIDKGNIEVLSFNPKKDRNKIVQSISYMPQKFGLYEDLTVIENLNLYSKLKNSDENLDSMLEFIGLKPFKYRLSGALSGGMKQKLGIACALIGRPKLLVLDEPSVGVDPLSRLELLEFVQKTVSKNTTVIWSSSYLDESYNFDFSIILDKGKIIFKGDTKVLGENFEDFEHKVIDLMGGYTKTPSVIAKNYHLIEHSRECCVLADNLSKRYKDFWAVKNNSFCIKKGEIFGLLGPNGAGKSTTFKMMCALIKPTSGKGYIMGYDVEKYPERARGYLGYMAQKFSLYSRLSLYDNLDFFAGIYGLFGVDKKKKIERIMEVFHLDHYKNTISGELPLGYKQRLSLACALIHEPPVLFLDEPTSGVDTISRKEFWNHIKTLSEIGVCVLTTTHFMDEARFCDNIGLFYDGEIIANDTPENLIKKEKVNDMQEVFIKLIREKKN